MVKDHFNYPYLGIGAHRVLTTHTWLACSGAARSVHESVPGLFRASKAFFASFSVAYCPESAKGGSSVFALRYATAGPPVVTGLPEP